MQAHKFVAFVLEYKMLGLVLLIIACGVLAGPKKGNTSNRAKPKAIGPDLRRRQRSINALRDGALHELLSSLFKPVDLRRWVRFDSELSILEDDLPEEPAPPARFFDVAVTELRRHGLVQTDFFDQLRSQFPRRRDDIDPVADMFAEVADSNFPETAPPWIQINRECIQIGRGATVGDISVGRATDTQTDTRRARCQTVAKNRSTTVPPGPPRSTASPLKTPESVE